MAKEGEKKAGSRGKKEVRKAKTTTTESTGKLSRGFDFLTTVRAEQLIEIPPKMLGPNMEGFREMVTFIGAQLPTPIGNSDTVMERLEEAEFNKEVRTRLAVFANVSAAPIKLEGTGPLAGYYDLYVTLSPTGESLGKTRYYSEDGVTGTFESEVSLSPMFELRPLGGGRSIFVDTVQTPIPGFPMRLGSTGGSWSLKPPTKNAVKLFTGQTLFYTSEVVITARNGVGILTKCLKNQAEVITKESPGRFARIDFPFLQEFSSIDVG